MTDQLLTQHFILWQCPVVITETRAAKNQPRQVRPVEAGYEYDEQELAEELRACRNRKVLRSPFGINPDELEAAYECFLS